MSLRGERARMAILVVAALLILCAAPFIGQPITPEAAGFVLLNLRVPRVLMAVVVGGALSLVGAVYQTLFQNPLATPGTVGTTAGAALGALVAIAFGAGRTAWGMSVVTLSAFAGAVGASSAVTAVAARAKTRLNDILLAGIACSLATGALSSGILATADAATSAAAVRWSIGHLPQVGYRGVISVAVIAVPVAAVLLALSRTLDALAAGEELAHSRGVDVRRVRAITIGFGSLGVAACVAWCGPIAFVELIVPHAVRMALGPRRSVLLPMSALCGGAFLALCDGGARAAIEGREVPVGVLTAALGAPVLFYLVVRQGR